MLCSLLVISLLKRLNASEILAYPAVSDSPTGYPIRKKFAYLNHPKIRLIEQSPYLVHPKIRVFNITLTLIIRKFTASRVIRLSKKLASDPMSSSTSSTLNQLEKGNRCCGYSDSCFS